jgi:hypothetical protein
VGPVEEADAAERGPTIESVPNGIELHPVLGEDVDMSYPFCL